MGRSLQTTSVTTQSVGINCVTNNTVLYYLRLKLGTREHRWSNQFFITPLSHVDTVCWKSVCVHECVMTGKNTYSGVWRRSRGQMWETNMYTQYESILIICIVDSRRGTLIILTLVIALSVTTARVLSETAVRTNYIMTKSFSHE